jgi:mono/diheme cytochrome c family protein
MGLLAASAAGQKWRPRESVMERSRPTMTSWMVGLVCTLAVAVGCHSAPTSAGGSCQSPLAQQAAPPDSEAYNPTGLQPSVEAGGVEPGGAAVYPVSYEAALTGGRVFQMHCAACHNARSLGERPFASYENAAVHMRVRANLTGEEYRKLIVFLRYWHDIPPQNPPVEPSPKRFIFSQSINELRPQQPPPGQGAPPTASMSVFPTQ